MKFTIFTSIMVAFLGAHTASALCCTECGGVLQACIDDCTADGTSSTTCGKICYGQGVSYHLGACFYSDDSWKTDLSSLIDWLCLRL